MTTSQSAARAYAAGARHRPMRDQEAEVFRYAAVGLQRAADAGALPRTRALADNARLWTAVMDLLRDPDNRLPESLRAGIISLGLAVEREMAQPEPDFAFLIGINHNVAAGLTGTAGTGDAR
jgi:flagellar biosynthesis regulator FlaF